jgi:hypothetical protein
MKTMQTSAILTATLQILLWLGVRKAAIITHDYVEKVLTPNQRLPPLSEITYLITPYAWLIPAALFVITIIQWKKEGPIILHSFTAANILFLVYLAMCAIGFSVPFVPALSEFRP